jgi:hypothetical protein
MDKNNDGSWGETSSVIIAVNTKRSKNIKTSDVNTPSTVFISSSILS